MQVGSSQWKLCRLLASREETVRDKPAFGKSYLKLILFIFVMRTKKVYFSVNLDKNMIKSYNDDWHRQFFIAYTYEYIHKSPSQLIKNYEYPYISILNSLFNIRGNEISYFLLLQ